MIKYQYLFIISLCFFSSQKNIFASVSESNITELYMKLSVKPFDSERLNEFTNLVKINQSELARTKNGQEFINEAIRFKKVNILKTKLDNCLGSDVLEFKSGRDILNAALAEPNTNINCSALSDKILDGDFSVFIDQFDKKVQSNSRIENKERSRALSERLFADTLIKAAKAEARLQYLITDQSKINGEWDLQVANSICSGEIKCPKELVQSAKIEALNQIKEYDSIGVRRESAKEASDRLIQDVSKMFTEFYSKNNPYYFENTDISHANPGLVKNLKNMSDDPMDLVSNLQTARHLITYRFDDTDQEIRKKTHQTKNGALIQKANINAIKEDLINSVPREFYNKQNMIQLDPLARQLASNQEFSDSLGFGVVPKISSIPSIGYSLLLLNENPSIDKTFKERLKQLKENSLIKEKTKQLERLRTNLKDMAEDLYQKKDEDNDILKKLLVSNPSAAAREVMQRPENLDIYCQSLKEIESEKQKDKYITYGLMAASIATIPFAMVASPLIGGLALAGVGAVDLAYSGVQFQSLREMSNLKEIACYGSQGDSSVCKEYEDNMDEAIMILSTAGLGLGISGGVKVVKFLPRINEMKDIIRTNPKFLSLTKGKKPVVLDGEEIPEDFWESMMKDLEDMRPNYESVVKSIDERHLANSSSGALRNITDADITRLFKGRILDENAINKLKVQVRSRERSNLGATQFAKESGWDPNKSESFIIRSEDIEPGFMQVDKTVHPVSLKDNEVFGYKKGWVQVQVHGSGTGFSNNGNVYSAKELAANIKAQGHTNQPIELASCWSGRPNGGGPTMAQQLADELGVPVVAPSRTLEMSGTPIITQSGKDLSPQGRWRVFYPNS